MPAPKTSHRSGRVVLAATLAVLGCRWGGDGPATAIPAPDSRKARRAARARTRRKYASALLKLYPRATARRRAFRSAVGRTITGAMVRAGRA